MPSQGQPNYGQQPDLFLARTFTGRPVGSAAMGSAPLTAKVVQAITDSNGKPAVIVAVDGFDTVATDGSGAPLGGFTAAYEPRFGSGSTPLVPPTGTGCIVSFTKSIGSKTGTVSAPSAFVIAFYGWPD